MPDTSLLSPFIVRLGGGLMLDKDAFTLPPGAATQLQNFEPDINGGYRRINGFTKYDSAQVGGSSGTILGVHTYKNQVAALRVLYLEYTPTRIKLLPRRVPQYIKAQEVVGLA